MNELMVQKKLAVSPSLLWTAWSDPEHIKKWWCPRPWQTIQVAMERKIGGCFDTQMRSPEGQDMELGRGCFLEVVPYRKLAFTSVLEGGFVPAQLPVGNDCLSLAFSALIEMEPVEGGTLYTARARHACPSARQAHADMGFVQGWGVCID